MYYLYSESKNLALYKHNTMAKYYQLNYHQGSIAREYVHLWTTSSLSHAKAMQARCNKSCEASFEIKTLHNKQPEKK